MAKNKNNKKPKAVATDYNAEFAEEVTAKNAKKPAQNNPGQGVSK